MPIPIREMRELTESEVSHFWSLVDIKEDHECWEWKGRVVAKGYGHFEIDGIYYVASRVSCLIHYGEEINSMYALHRCDNPPCVNFNHLFLGTILDNHRDMIAKGRDSLNKERRARTHCRQGHEYTEENTGDHYGRRCCKECNRLYQASDQRRLRKQEVRVMKKAGTWGEDKMIRKTRKAGFKIC